MVFLLHLNAPRDWKYVSTIWLSKAPRIRFHAHLSFGILVSAKEAHLATCELGHLHWAGHCPLTPSRTDIRSKNITLKYNIILRYIANAHCLARFAVATAGAEDSLLLDCCWYTTGKYIFFLICLLFHQLPILFDCWHCYSICLVF